jgi:hypothetical protein
LKCVKVFAEGIKQAFQLSRTEMRIFCLVLEVYEQEKMTGGFADSITLFWFNDTLNGQSVDSSPVERSTKSLLILVATRPLLTLIGVDNSSKGLIIGLKCKFLKFVIFAIKSESF